jgi:hypothetical protein
MDIPPLVLETGKYWLCVYFNQSVLTAKPALWYWQSNKNADVRRGAMQIQNRDTNGYLQYLFD